MTVKRKFQDLDHDQLREALMFALRDMSGASVFFHSAVAERLGLNITDHKCADLIARKGISTASELAEETGLTTGAITGVIDRLERVGLVRRDPDPDDRRRMRLSIVENPALHARMWELFKPIAKASQDMMEDYSDEELSLVLDVVLRCCDLTRVAARAIRADGEVEKESAKAGKSRVAQALL